LNDLPTKKGAVLAPFLLLCLIGFAAFFSSYLRIPVMPLFAATMGASPAEVGSINGAFMLTAGLLSIPAGLIADRIGRKLPIVMGLLAAAASSLLVTLCHQPGEMAWAYVFFGIGLAALAPGMLSLVADVIPSQKLGLAYGWYTTVIYIAMTLGPAAGGYLATVLGLRQVFVVSGVLLVGVAILALLLLPSGPPRHKADVHVAIAASFQLLRNRHLLACLLATAGSCVGFGVFFTFLPLYAAGKGFDPAQAGLVFAAQAITNVFGRVPLGKVADRVERRTLISCGLLCLAGALIALGQVDSLPMLVVCSVGIGIGMALTFTALGALIAEMVPALQRGLAMGMYNSCVFLGMMCGSTLMGMVLKEIGYPLGFVAAGAIALLTMFLFILMIGKLPTAKPN
jgi:MFS family permease